MIIWLWVGFVAFVLAMLALDLGVFHRHAHIMSIRESLTWSAVWIALALAFNVGVYFLYARHWLDVGLNVAEPLTGHQAALQFFTGYLIEKSLSLDNLFVIMMIFAYFQVPRAYEHRALAWGIMGAIILRGVMIAAGAALITRFSWIIYVFGALLLLTALRMMISREDSVHPEKNPLVKLVRRLMPVAGEYDRDHFFTRLDGRLAATPLLLVVAVIESMDVLFAVDSIPAIFAVTTDPFLVFTSNIFAILGLRALYFAIAGLIHRFRYLKVSLVYVLGFIGVKMLLAHYIHIPTAVSLGVVCGILLIGALASIIVARRQARTAMLAAGNEVIDLAAGAWRQIRRLVIIVVGSTILLIGVAMIVLPGPAIVVIPLGLAILAIEFVWARNLLRRVKQAGHDAARSLRQK